MEERRAFKRVNLGRLNYETIMKMFFTDVPVAWEDLTITQRASYSAAASAIANAVHDAPNSKNVENGSIV